MLHYETIDRDECLQLLGKATLGRIGLSVRGLPAIVPVDFCLLDDQILVRTRGDAQLPAVLAGQVVSFLVDDLPTTADGWSVSVTGRGFEAGDVLGITVELISGRRVLPSA
jgi:hypothetical protein